MAVQPCNPSQLAPPAAAYSHAVVVPPGYRLLMTSGVVPTRADGTVPHDLDEQAEVVWESLLVLLGEAGMTVRDTVSITTYVVVGEDLGVVMAARDRAMAGHRPASTLVTVPALARPQWRMEIALVAAAP
jgi:2-iminobutanoate/2-iminopropanoate deaminase